MPHQTDSIERCLFFVYSTVFMVRPSEHSPMPVAVVHVSLVSLNLTRMQIFLQKDLVIKEGRYRIDLDVLLFPWRLTYKGPGSGHIPKGSFGKVHLAQDNETRKRMACKRVSPGMQKLLPKCYLTSHPFSLCIPGKATTPFPISLLQYILIDYT